MYPKDVLKTAKSKLTDEQKEALTSSKEELAGPSPVLYKEDALPEVQRLFDNNELKPVHFAILLDGYKKGQLLNKDFIEEHVKQRFSLDDLKRCTKPELVAILANVLAGVEFPVGFETKNLLKKPQEQEKEEEEGEEEETNKSKKRGKAEEEREKQETTPKKSKGDDSEEGGYIETYTSPSEYEAARKAVEQEADDLIPPRHVLPQKYFGEFAKRPFLADKYDRCRTTWIDNKVALKLNPDALEATYLALTASFENAELDAAAILVEFDKGREVAKLLRRDKKPGILDKFQPIVEERMKEEREQRKFQKAVDEHKKKSKTGVKPDGSTKSKKCRHCGYMNPNHSPADC